MDRGRRFRPVFELLEERRLLKGPDEAPSLGPPPAEGPGVIHVDSVAELQGALDNDIQSNTTIVIQPGVYNLTSTLFLNPNTARSHITIRGATDDFDDVVIRGQGMDDADIPHGIWIGNLQDLTIANLTIGEVYFHPIQIHGELGADDVHLYHVRLYDCGEQFVKSADGADNCSVKYSVLEYTNGPPTTDHGGGTGYTNAIDVLDGANWVIQHNLIRNFHTPDDADNLWNPAILMWRGSSNTLVEGNTLIDVDRAIAFGLEDTTPASHYGGIIRNNFVYLRPGLFSPDRDSGGDAPIIVWDSRDTQVHHNTIITNGNHFAAIEFRFDTIGGAARNNLADQGIQSRNSASFAESGNFFAASAGMFADAAYNGASDQTLDLHLVDNAATQTDVLDQATAVAGIGDDFDGQGRATTGNVDIGADEYQPTVVIGVFRRGKWRLDRDGQQDFDELPFTLGKRGDKPVRGDFNGDGIEELGVFRGAGIWLIDLNHDGKLNDGRFARYGRRGDRPVVGDWDNDDVDNIGVFRNGQWWLDDGDRRRLNDPRIVFGKKWDQPAAGDWDGDGDDEIAVFRAGAWYRDVDLNGLLDATDAFATYGQAGDRASVGDWDSNGASDLAVFRAGQWYLDDGNQVFDDPYFLYGMLGDTPV